MGTPAKRRKLNNSTKDCSPAPRNLDYFFGKKRDLPAQPVENAARNTGSSSQNPELTDEQLARKLQAEWAQEDADAAARGGSEIQLEIDAREPSTKAPSPVE